MEPGKRTCQAVRGDFQAKPASPSISAPTCGHLRVGVVGVVGQKGWGAGQGKGQSGSRSQTEKEHLFNSLTEQMGRPTGAGERRRLVLGHTKSLAELGRNCVELAPSLAPCLSPGQCRFLDEVGPVLCFLHRRQ